MSTWISFFNLGLEHKRRVEIRQAKQAFDRSLQLSIARHDNRGIAANLAELGGLYMRANYFETADDYLNRALKIAASIPDRHLMAACLQVMSDLDLRRGKAEDALDKCRRGRKLIEKDASPRDLKSFDIRIEMLTSDKDVHIYGVSPEDYRREIGPEEDEPIAASGPSPEPLSQDVSDSISLVMVMLEGFPAPARFRDVLAAAAETWKRGNEELSQRYGTGWCVPPDFENAVNANGSHNYVVSQHDRVGKTNPLPLWIQSGSVSLSLRVRYDISRGDKGEEPRRITHCFQRHWADVVGIPFEPSQVEKMTIIRKEDGSREVVKPGLRSLGLKLPIPGPDRARLVVPAIEAALTDAHREISRFAGVAWCANWVHVLPPVFADEMRDCRMEGRLPACVLYPGKRYADIRLEILEKVTDLEAVRTCIEKHWRGHQIDFEPRRRGALALLQSRNIIMVILAVVLLAGLGFFWLR